MFRYEYPEFKEDHLLTASMLEQLRDTQRNSVRLLYQGYGNGIVNGCELTWNDNRLIINSGVIHWKGNLYYLEKPLVQECKPEAQLRYLIVKFHNEKRQLNRIIGETGLYLRMEPARIQDEMELCRFRFQEGSRLRSSCKDFQDFSTEYDTINIIHAPYAGVSGVTIHPAILLQFAQEMLETEMSDAFEASFVMNVLANDGHMSKRAIQQYLQRSCGCETISDRNGDLYQELLNVLSGRKRRDKTSRREGEIPRRILLM